MNRRSGVVHAIAECRTCGWESDSYKNALAIGAKHARHHGHKVVVEQCISVEYDGTAG